MSAVAERLVIVLDRIKAAVQTDSEEAELYAGFLDDMLDTIHSEDSFGTEGQCDPRGDFRNGSWSILRGIEP